MKINKLAQKSLLLLLILSLLTPHFLFSFTPSARAANLTNAMMRLNRMTQSQTDVGILVVARAFSTATEDALQINFDSSWTVDSTASNITITAAGIPTTIGGENVTAWPGVGSPDTADAVTGNLVTFPSGNLTNTGSPAPLYAFFITGGIDSPAAEQSVHTMATRASSADVDTAQVATRTVTNDQVVVNATVPPSFSFTLSANTDTFSVPTAPLDSDAIISTTGITVTVGTNASNGWSAWLASVNAGLTSTATSETIATAGTVDGTPTTIDPNDANEYYQLDVNTPTQGSAGTSGVPTVAAEYDGSATTGGTFSTSLQEIAYGDGTTTDDSFILTGRAVPSAIRAAATDYTDTWTVVGAANF